ncbi:hypothetical protein T4E_4651, partial [Trichinella pseudospiralis]
MAKRDKLVQQIEYTVLKLALNRGLAELTEWFDEEKLKCIR